MKTISIGAGQLRSSKLAYGCWRIGGTSNPEAVTAELAEAGKKVVIAAYEAGYTLFDNADIYCGGMAERIFGSALKEVPGMRDNILVATKCGIRKAGDPSPDAPYRYDFSAEYIIRCCEESLERMGIEMIDIYQLHRPDYLCDPEEVVAAFETLYEAGKVRAFGVSNFTPSQVAMLQKYCPMKLVVNQVEISLIQTITLDDGTLDQCISEKITPMAWSPLGGGAIASGAAKTQSQEAQEKVARVCTALDRIASERGTTRTVIALAWLLRHPAGIVPIVGSTKPERIREAVKATEIDLTREEWYALMEASRGSRLP